jgi:outer membrane protein OmpA-like peptidoglycan-associated protein
MRFKSVIFFLLLITQTLKAQQIFSLYFESDAFILTKSEHAKLEEWLKKNKESKILSMNGFTDNDGSEGYNDTLSAKRVQYVYEKIKDKIKIRNDFKKLYFGKLHKQSQNKEENRRVTLFYLAENELSQENILIPEAEIVEKIPVKPAIEYPNFIVINNPDGSKTEMNLNAAWMKKLGETPVGEKLVMENVEFHINTFAIVIESRPRLFELLYAMILHPTLKIEIGGHICCISKDHRNLSTDRAKAIKNFLVQYGIEKDRVTFKGYGSSMPIYPIPEKNEAERAANRRVEITITSQ